VNVSIHKHFFPFRFSVFLALIATAGPVTLPAGNADPALTTVTRDVRYVAGWPLTLDSGGLMALASYAVFAGGLYAGKREINDGVQDILDWDGEKTNGALRGFKFLGDHGVVAGSGALLIVAGLELGSSREVETGVMILESYALTGVFTVVSQFILAEERPYQGGRMRFFTPGGHGVSGHSALAASLVGPVSHQYLRRHAEDGAFTAVGKELARITLWTLPFLTGVSRIESNEHYAWNVLLGLSIGYGAGHLIARSHEIAQEEAGAEEGETRRMFHRREGRLVWYPAGVSYLF
jgi:membrane-associated phospholipid phosphatase